MKSHVNMMKGRATSRVSNQQAAFELKQRVNLALTKVADRDTYQLGVEELEKTVERLTSDGFAPFLSCILDTDSEKKSAVRRECVRLMGTLATFHDGLVRPHLGKVVASIVKRLKDSDSVVRDACVETFGVLASKLSSNGVETDGLFVVLVRPLFEALGEQNRHVQFGSALSLARVIDNIHDPPPLVLQKMLARTVKLLKNPHFMAKPAVIELNRSIVLAGGTATHSSLSAALISIQESLKNNDWGTRKAACAALGDIASCGAACLGSYRTSCIRSLESCRFDKVRPVRDIALQALQLWKSLPGPDTPEPSEAGSSVREKSYKDDYCDITSACGSTQTDKTPVKFSGELAKKRIPQSARNFGCKSQQSGRNDWQIEIAMPKSQNTLISENHNDESEASSLVTKRCTRINSDVRSVNNIGCEFVEVDFKPECSSVSNIFTESAKSNVITNPCDGFDSASLVKSTGTSQRFGSDELNIEEQKYVAKVNERTSLGSTITESTPCTTHDCCSQTEKEMALIRKQLLEIESKQSSLMDMLKVFTTKVMDSVSMVQTKVSNLELVVDKMAQQLVYGERYSDASVTTLLKRSPSIVSPRVSMYTPRPSYDSNKQPPLLPTKTGRVWPEKAVTETNSFGKQKSDMWSEAHFKTRKSSFSKGTPTNFPPEIGIDQRRKIDIFDQVPATKARITKLETKNNPQKVMKDYLYDGDLDSAYTEALAARNELLLFEIFDRTGPVLDSLSQKTASNLLSILALYLLEQRFVNSIVPWLQQLVELINIHGPTCLTLSAKAKGDFLFAIQEAARSDNFNAAERKFFTDIGKALHQFWG